MNFQENIKEGLRAIRDNILRTSLTAAIIAIGITSLVGILTAVDSMQASVKNSFAQLGANSFDIKVETDNFSRRRRSGQEDKQYPPIKYKEAVAFKEKFTPPARVSIQAPVTGAAEVKYGGKTTNPNIQVTGGNEHYLVTSGFNLELGRNFSQAELNNAVFVGIIGKELAETLFDKRNPLNKTINIRGYKIKVIGVMERSGSSMGSSSSDRMVLIPFTAAARIPTQGNISYNITTALDLDNPKDFEIAMGEATRVMRQIRKDPLGKPNSFEVERSESAVQRLESITSYLKIGGGVVGFITLIGASIGLMNIMMVSVTERTREIGVRKALGATPYRIRQQFLVEAIVICQIGGLAGVLLGILMGNFVASLISSGDFLIPWFWIVLGLIISALVGIISGYYPAYKASRLDPVDALRFE